MFTPRREVLRAKSGTLAETPLPLLLHALASEERSATLELSLRNLVKRVHVEGGVPVGCESNLLHESVGKVLVAKGKLTEAQHHALQSESAATGKALQALLLEKQLVSGFELFKLLQSSLAHTLLDAFRWGDAKWRLLDLDEVATPIKLNLAQLVFTGCLQLPAETLAAHFALDEAKPLALLGNPQEELKLAAKDLRLVQALKKRAPLATLAALPGLSRDEVLRRLYALCVLELADFAEAVDARGPAVAAPVPSAPVPAPAPSAPPAAVAPQPPAEDAALLDALSAEYLSCRAKDPFDLLGVPVDAPLPALQRAFLAKSEALSPLRFQHPEAKARAQAVQLALARAYGSLCEPEQHALHKKRREVAEENRRRGGPNPRAAAEHFRIKTELLDAKSQFDEGRRRLDAGQLKSAVEHFEYAADIEPTGRTLAWLALARFRQAPDFALERSLALLADACSRDPNCEEAWAFRGDLALSVSRHAEAEEAYRHAARLNPRELRYVTALKSLRGGR